MESMANSGNATTTTTYSLFNSVITNTLDPSTHPSLPAPADAGFEESFEESAKPLSIRREGPIFDYETRVREG